MIQPRQVILFSGHMIDHPESSRRRFPESLATAAGEKFAALLDEWAAGPLDLAICGGACGGDILFAEAAQSRQIPLAIFLPLPEPEFCRESVSFAGAHWERRLHNLLQSPATNLRLLPPEESPAKSIWERNNEAMGKAATQWGPHRTRLLCLWDGQTGFGPGGTAHMVDWARSLGIPIHQVRPQDLQEPS